MCRICDLQIRQRAGGGRVREIYMDDYEISDEPCPKCKHDITHWRLCDCDDGYCDAHDGDPINYMPGEIEYLCHTCKGTGVVSWCPSCGANLIKYPGKEPGEGE